MIPYHEPIPTFDDLGPVAQQAALASGGFFCIRAVSTVNCRTLKTYLAFSPEDVATLAAQIAAVPGTIPYVRHISVEQHPYSLLDRRYV